MTASIAERRFVLPEDVLFVPITELADDVRARLGGDAGDHAVTRPGFRSPARLVDDDTVALLQTFRSGRSIVEAIVDFAVPRGLDPADTLTEAFPALQLFARSKVLVPEGSPDAEGLRARYAPGQRVQGFTVDAVLQVTHDTEVYRATDTSGARVALKCVRADAPLAADAAVRREATLLAHLDGDPTPLLVGHGRHDREGGRRWLAVSWVEGESVAQRAHAIRTSRRPGWRLALLDLVRELVRAFAVLHAGGVVHGDVHPRNLLVDDRGRVWLIDLGAARAPDLGVKEAERANTGFTLDPQAAGRMLAGLMPGPVDGPADQFSVAAVAYSLITGKPQVPAEIEADALLTSLAEGGALPFTRVGFEAWPAVEAVLRRALAPIVADRFPDVSAFADALDAAVLPAPSGRADALLARGDAALAPFLSPPPPDLRDAIPEGPLAGLDHGAAGVAWALWRRAVLRDDAHALALADVWARRAEELVDHVAAWHHPEVPDPDMPIDACSVLHRRPGVHLIRGLVAASRHDYADLHAQVEAFCVCSVPSHSVVDLSLGRAGTLVAGAALRRALAVVERPVPALDAVLRVTLDDLTAVLEDVDAVPWRQPLSLAHGWVGLVFAVLRASRALGRTPPGVTHRLLHRLAAAVGPVEDPAIPGWCNGTAGHVLTLLEGHAAFDDPELLRDASRAGRALVHHADDHVHLCCGLTGRLFATLALFQHTGETVWRDHAESLGRRLDEGRIPDSVGSRPRSLFWGELGAALAKEELAHPERARLPVFGWG